MLIVGAFGLTVALALILPKTVTVWIGTTLLVAGFAAPVAVLMFGKPSTAVDAQVVVLRCMVYFFGFALPGLAMIVLGYMANRE